MTMTTKPRAPRSLRRTQRGLSLVELMVALTIGLFLLGAVGIIYVNTATTSRSSTLESQMNEDAALALELLQQQIRLTGFSNVDASGNRLFPGQAVRGCDGGFADNTAVFLDPASPPLLTCNGGTGPDALAVRYEASLLNSQSVTDAGVQRPGNCAHEGLAKWDASAEGASDYTDTALVPLSEQRSLADNRYYIADDNGTPTLWCQGRTGAAFGNATALIPNIEDMQVQYAVTALPSVGNPIPHQVAGYVDADHAVLGDPAINWSRVAALRVCLVARSARPVPTGDNAVADIGRYIDCAGAEQTPNDRFLRRAYVTTIQLRNMRPGLPSDYELGGDPWQYMYDN